MTTPYLDYDSIANDYNQRYPSSRQWERGDALLNFAKQIKAKTILEAGSGTGFWLNLLHQVTPQLYGLDFSAGMIALARKQPAPLKLTRSRATQLPYQSATFDLIYCVDAIHHFDDHHAFIREAFRLLKPGGALAIIGHDPHKAGPSSWYIYSYFDSVYDTDLRRYPAGTSVLKWMNEEGFGNPASQLVEHIHNEYVGEDVFADPFIKHNATSQLALLSDESYQAGLQNIRASLLRSKERNKPITFRSEIFIRMWVGFR